jgi:hypothetical protein
MNQEREKEDRENGKRRRLNPELAIPIRTLHELIDSANVIEFELSIDILSLETIVLIEFRD